VPLGNGHGLGHGIRNGQCELLFERDRERDADRNSLGDVVNQRLRARDGERCSLGQCIAQRKRDGRFVGNGTWFDDCERNGVTLGSVIGLRRGLAYSVGLFDGRCLAVRVGVRYRVCERSCISDFRRLGLSDSVGLRLVRGDVVLVGIGVRALVSRAHSFGLGLGERHGLGEP